MSTGALIRQAREAEGLTQAALARRLGITQPSIARLEAAGDEVTVATLQRALNAMGRALVLEVVPRKSSVDETLLYETLRLTPDARLASFARAYANVRELALEARERGRVA
jgi:transcriptional regulator with XRE-family HTH domain